VFRNAAAFGADGVVLSPGCGDPFYPKAVRSRYGWLARGAVRPCVRRPAALGRPKEAGFTLVALTPQAGAVD
jgi:tRNA G18 (ribose-2'-O)-methylase SpoU